MIASAMVLLIALQQAGDRVEAVYSADKWTLDYPVAIEPQVSEYYDCLRAGSYTIGAGRSFEVQYREDDLPRCSDKGVRLQAEANAVLARRSQSAAMSAEEVAVLFENIRALHLARGASIDEATRTRLVTEPEYRQVRLETTRGESGGVPAARCVDRIHALTQERSAFMSDNADSIAALHAQDSYSDEDRRALLTYQGQLQRYNSLITIEQRGCAAARQRELADFDNAQD